MGRHQHESGFPLDLMSQGCVIQQGPSLFAVELTVPGFGVRETDNSKDNRRMRDGGLHPTHRKGAMMGH